MRLSTDHDPLFRFHRWRANLRILDIEELKSVPFVPRSHPFVERLIGTFRREYLDQIFFWNALNLHRKLDRFATYYNEQRLHAGLSGRTPLEQCDTTVWCGSDGLWRNRGCLGEQRLRPDRVSCGRACVSLTSSAIGSSPALARRPREVAVG
jgi:hypothetical protein